MLLIERKHALTVLSAANDAQNRNTKGQSHDGTQEIWRPAQGTQNLYAEQCKLGECRKS